MQLHSNTDFSVLLGCATVCQPTAVKGGVMLAPSHSSPGDRTSAPTSPDLGHLGSFPHCPGFLSSSWTPIMSGSYPGTRGAAAAVPPFRHVTPTPLGHGPLPIWKCCPPPPRPELFPQTDAAATPPASDRPTKPHQPRPGIWEPCQCPSPPQPHPTLGWVHAGVRAGKEGGLAHWVIV